MMDPVALQFLELGIWLPPNQVGSPARTGPNGNLQRAESCRCLNRDRWDAKIDHHFNSNNKIFFRYSHGYHRGQNGDNFGNPEFNASREINPTDDINGVISYTTIISSRLFNEFRVGYNRRASSNPERPESAKDAITIPGVTAGDVPVLQHRVLDCADGLHAAGGRGQDHSGQRYVCCRTAQPEDGIRDDPDACTATKLPLTALPSGQYNFTGGASLPFAQNTGNDFAAFLMGRSDERDVQQATGDIHAAAVEPGIVLPGRLESQAGSDTESGCAVDVLFALHDEVGSNNRSSIRTAIDPVTGRRGRHHASEGHDRQEGPEQLPTAAGPGLDVPSQVGIPGVVRHHDRGQYRHSGRLRRIRRHLQHPPASRRSA